MKLAIEEIRMNGFAFFQHNSRRIASNNVSIEPNLKEVVYNKGGKCADQSCISMFPFG